MIEVLQPGLTTIQDAGRKGFETFGMPRSGVLDPFLAHIANHLTGNSLDLPLLEFALVGPSLLFHTSHIISIASFSARYNLNGKPVLEFQAFPVSSGSILNFDGMEGWFGYIAVSGGIRSDKILGSASVYSAAGIGSMLKRKDTIETETAIGRLLGIKKESLSLRQDNVLQILKATHTNIFSQQSKELLNSEEYKISVQSDRMGIRLQGTKIEAPDIRRSIPTLPGVVQVARSGQPIILGPEGPVTGGYPQIGILSQSSWTTLAGIKPGRSVRFEWIDHDTARKLRKQRNSIFSNEDLWQLK